MGDNRLPFSNVAVIFKTFIMGTPVYWGKPCIFYVNMFYTVTMVFSLFDTKYSDFRDARCQAIPKFPFRKNLVHHEFSRFDLSGYFGELFGYVRRSKRDESNKYI